MGVNATPQQAEAYRGDPTYQALNGAAGTGGRGIPGAATQLAAALLASQRQRQINQQLGSSQANYQAPSPGTLPPAVAPPLTANGGVAVMGAQPPGMLPGAPAPNPQALAPQ